MRIKKLFQFLDITAATPPRRQPRPTYRLTIVSLSSTLNTLRKQLYYELQGLDLRVSQVLVSRTDVEQLACTSVTLICPPHLRATLGAIAQRLGQSTDVRRIQWETAGGSAIAVLPA